MKLVWLTDIHLNFLKSNARQKFYHEIISTDCDAVLISGDIAEAPCLIDIMTEMAVHIIKPIYFILGNHDYYRGKIHEVRDALTSLSKTNKQLFWLPASGIQQLDSNTALLGQDGWADGRLGDYQNSTVALNDSRMIADLFQEKVLGKFQLLEKMQQLADADAAQLQSNLLQAISQHPKKIVVLTHVPPFKEACMHKGNASDDDWLPYFSSKVTGDILSQIAEENPSVEFLVLCGHTHSPAQYKPLVNLTVKAGHAEYYKPEIQELIVL
jgi:predicted phosphohydrolase